MQMLCLDSETAASIGRAGQTGAERAETVNGSSSAAQFRQNVRQSADGIQSDAQDTGREGPLCPLGRFARR